MIVSATGYSYRVALGVYCNPKYRHDDAHIQGACCVVPGCGRQTSWSGSHDENECRIMADNSCVVLASLKGNMYVLACE